jgi:hypothetical protein
MGIPCWLIEKCDEKDKWKTMWTVEEECDGRRENDVLATFLER